MTKARQLVFLAGALLISACGVAHAEEMADAQTPAASTRELPPAPLTPWRVSGHLIGDSYAHVTDIGGTPTYLLGDRAYQAWHRLLRRDKMRLKVRLTMDPPPAAHAVVQADAPTAAE